MFVDHVEIEVQAGSGGNGAATFRTEKYIPHGGPDGGDGGRGGSVYLQVDTHLSTLLDFRYKRSYKAQRGGDGARKHMYGKDGEDLVLSVPPGTVAYDAETGELLADLSGHTTRAMVARGGVGGRGNMHFATSVQQAPKFRETGEPGEVRRLRLELKLLADVGLLGFPSVGKSTLIAAVSAARPKIAEYPFTTLVPNLGVVSMGPNQSFVMADLPGIIEGAHAGAGLGHQFLRHVERTRVLIHVLDVGGLSGRDPVEDFHTLNRELLLYNEALTHLPQLVALNKIDINADPGLAERTEQALASTGARIFRISAAAHTGLQPLLYAAWQLLEEARAAQPQPVPEDEVVLKAERRQDDRRWEVSRDEPGLFVVRGKGIERMVAMTDLENSYGVRRLQRSLEKIGVYRRLAEAGAKDGDTVRIGKVEFDYIDEFGEDEEA
jgi:GTP-binding protein